MPQSIGTGRRSFAVYGTIGGNEDNLEEAAGTDVVLVTRDQFAGPDYAFERRHGGPVEPTPVHLLGGPCQLHYFRATGSQRDNLLGDFARECDIPGILPALQCFAIARGFHPALCL